MSILERRKMKAANLLLSAPMAAMAVVGLSALKSEAGVIASGDILVDQGGSSSTDPVGAGGSTLLLQELNPANTQQSPVQTFNITNLSGSQLYTNSNGSNGMLTLSNNGTIVAFGGYVGLNATNELKQNTRAAATLDANGNFVQAATYNESATTGNGQVRSVYTPNGSTWYFGDKAGVYLASTSAAANAVNVRSLKGFGGTLYASSQNTTTALNTVSSDGTTATTLTGFPASAAATDFVLLASGATGSTFDTAYVAEGTSIAKFGLISGVWTAEGTITASAAVNGLTATEIGGNTGADLYYTTTASAFSVVDSANQSTTANGGTSTDLYDTPTGTALFGISLAPVAATPEPATLGLVGMGAACLLSRRRRRRA